MRSLRFTRWCTSISCVVSLLFVCTGVVDRSVADDEIDARASQAAIEELKSWLAASSDERPALGKQEFASVPLIRDDADAVRRLLWQEHVKQLRAARVDEMKAKVLKLGDLEMPFHYSVFGKMPDGGRSLYISLHGGGGAPKQVNDQQWENQKRLYRPEEGVYLCPRAPTNTWNLWHQGHIDVLFDRLIQNLVVFEGVNPDRVYVMGYSAGGDGVYQLAPRMADRWAAAAMMAGHPNETSPLGLRNIAFTLHVGGKDAAYNRNKVAADWEKKLADLRKNDPEGYVHWAKIYPDKGHWLDREDAAALPWMAKHTRNPVPKRVVWKQDDVTHSSFYWLAVDKDNKRARSEVVATREGQTIDVRSSDVKDVIVRLDDRLLDLDQAVKITSGERTLFEGRVSRTIATLSATLNERSDLQFVFSAQQPVSLESGN